jgi:hypothetical protein
LFDDMGGLKLAVHCTAASVSPPTKYKGYTLYKGYKKSSNTTLGKPRPRPGPGSLCYLVSFYGEWWLGLFTRRPCPPVAMCSQGRWAIRVYVNVFITVDEK